MKSLCIFAVVAALIFACAASPSFADPAGSSFTYQGKLTNSSGVPLTGTYDLTFRLYDAQTGGNQIGSTFLASGVVVQNGLFTVRVDFSSTAYNGEGRWIETSIGSTTLSPRMPLTPVPYALHALSVADSSITSAKIPTGQVVKSLNGLFDVVTLSPGTNITITPSGNTLTISAPGGTGWSLLGNAGTDPASSFLGTTDSQPLEIRVNNSRALRLEPASRSQTIGNYIYQTLGANVLGGWKKNSITSGVIGATVAGGGYAYGRFPLMPTDHPNTVTDDYGTVSGGADNRAGDNAGTTSDKTYATVGGGVGNVASGLASTVPGGNSNTASGDYSFAAGNRAKANYPGTFVWADNTAADFTSTANNQFLIRASGGVGINTASPSQSLQIDSGDAIIRGTGNFGTAGNEARLFLGDTWNYIKAINNGGLRIGTYDAPDLITLTSSDRVGIGTTTPQTALDVNGMVRTSEVGTTDNTRLALKVNNQDALTMLLNSNAIYGTSPNIVGGFSNIVASGVVGAVIGGGGGVISGTDYFNGAYDHYCVVSGGAKNTAGNPALGLGNATFSTVGGGTSNTASGNVSTVAGGQENQASGTFATVGGGAQNIASGNYSTVPGGYLNNATASFSFAAGKSATAAHANSFVWADGAALSTSKTRQFLINAVNGVGIGTNNTTEPLTVGGGIKVDEFNQNDGSLTFSALRFGGGGSGEGIASKRTSWGNQNGLDFYTGFNSRMSIQNGGNVTVNGGNLVVNGGRLLVGDETTTQAKLTVNSPTTMGLYVKSIDSEAIRASSEHSLAGMFFGNVTVAGTINASWKQFKIDHPLDPENKYLNHSSIESSESKNMYDGKVVLDGNGEAVVQLPDWFEALNKDFRYQLTAIGAPGPNLYIAEEIKDNQFKIAGGKPGMKVCWQVTGNRHDAYAVAHPIVVEELKSPEERGHYIHPAPHGQPETKNLSRVK